MVELFNNYIFEPLYNLLILLINYLPFHSAALAVIVLTVLVKLALLPLAYKMAHTQKKMKEISPEIEKIKAEYKDDKQEQARKLIELYKQHDIKPFASFFSILIQIPIIIGIYLVFLKSGLPNINTDLLYSFVKAPEYINLYLFNINILDKSIIIAFFAGLSQYIFAKITKNDIKFTDEKEGLKADLQKSIQIQMQFVLPIIIAIAAYTLGVGIALYFIVSNLFQIGQEYFFRFKKLK